MSSQACDGFISQFKKKKVSVGGYRKREPSTMGMLTDTTFFEIQNEHIPKNYKLSFYMTHKFQFWASTPSTQTLCSQKILALSFLCSLFTMCTINNGKNQEIINVQNKMTKYIMIHIFNGIPFSIKKR